MTPEQLFAQKVLAELRIVLNDLPAAPEVLRIESTPMMDSIEIKLGDKRSVAITFWELKV